MKQYREKMNKQILSSGDKNLKRFFNIDHNVYEPGALSKKSKEMLGLVASLVLRCNDCIGYHVDQCIKQGVTREEFSEVCSIGLIVGGSITIPHIRYIYELLDQEQIS